jgi:ankyrin repeat protein
MTKGHIFIASILAFSSIFIKADSRQSVEVINNSAQVMNIAANTADRSFSFNHSTPAFCKSLILLEITKLQSLQEMLFDAILNDSPSEIRHAMRLGASINYPKDGKTPLFWAISFHRTNAAKYLLDHGAI